MTTQEPATKKCPQCAEEILTDAVLCRFCRYDYRSGQTATLPPPPRATAPMPTHTNGLAIASFVLGILWIWWIGSTLAVIFGHISLSNIKKSGGIQKGEGLAIAGLVLGYIGIATFIGFVILVIIGASVGTEVTTGVKDISSALG